MWLWCFLCTVYVLGFGVIRWGPVLGCYQRLGGYEFVMSWCFELDLFKFQPWWCVDMLYDGCIYCLLLFSQFPCAKLRWYAYEILDLTIFESLISYIWFVFQSLWEDWSVWLLLMMSLCDMFWLDHFGVFDLYYFVILYGCSLRTDGYCDLLWDMLWLLVKNHWLLWFIIDAFSCQ